MTAEKEGRCVNHDEALRARLQNLHAQAADLRTQGDALSKKSARLEADVSRLKAMIEWVQVRKRVVISRSTSSGEASLSLSTPEKAPLITSCSVSLAQQSQCDDTQQRIRLAIKLRKLRVSIC